MSPRLQRTLAGEASCHGRGFLTGCEIRVQFHPAPINHGVVFERRDLTGSPQIPATLPFVLPRTRRTAIGTPQASIELIEHAMAALAGLQIDNCVVSIDGPELPGGDGSSLIFVEPLLQVGALTQPADRPVLRVTRPVSVRPESGEAGIVAEPTGQSGLVIAYDLDYGPESWIPRQQAMFRITPSVFVREIAHTRTFVTTHEAEALRAQGIGQHVTEQDLLVFDQDGPRGQSLRVSNECARHKILDCIGDFALLGSDLEGVIFARRSGHALNHTLCQQLQAAAESSTSSRAA